MPTTKYKIAEQVLLRISKGYPDNASGVQLEDIIEAVGQKANEAYRAEYFNQTLPSGETIPDGLVLNLYENVPVVSYGDRSRAVLPVMPISLPRNMGVYEITPNVVVTQNGITYNYILTESGLVIDESSGQGLIVE